MKTSESIVKVSAAIVEAQALVKTASKDAENTFFNNSKYATLASVIEACKEALAKAKLAVIQAPIKLDDQLFVETRIQHESGEYFEILTPLLFTKQDMQGFGSAITYAKRYALGSLLNIATEEDDDGNDAAKKEADKKTPAQTNSNYKQPEVLADFVMTCGSANVKGKKLKDIDTFDLNNAVQFFRKKQQSGAIEHSVQQAEKWLQQFEVKKTMNGAPKDPPKLNTEEMPF